MLVVVKWGEGRLQEWERFESNCQLLRELDEMQIMKISELQHEQRKTKSVGSLHRDPQKAKHTNPLRKAASANEPLSPV